MCKNLLTSTKVLRLKWAYIFFLSNDIHRFPERMGCRSHGHGKHFHQDVNEIETRHLGRWDISITVHYWLSLMNDGRATLYSQSTIKCNFHLREYINLSYLLIFRFDSCDFRFFFNILMLLPSESPSRVYILFNLESGTVNWVILYETKNHVSINIFWSLKSY